jgi:hypothetical protein
MSRLTTPPPSPAPGRAPTPDEEKRARALSEEIRQRRQAIGEDNALLAEKSRAARQKLGLPPLRPPERPERPEPEEKPLSTREVVVDGGRLEIAYYPFTPEPEEGRVGEARAAAEKAVEEAWRGDPAAARYLKACKELPVAQAELAATREALRNALAALALPNLAADSGAWNTTYMEAKHLKILVPSLAGRVDALGKEVQAAEAPAREALERVVRQTVNARDRRHDNGAALDKIVAAVERVAGALGLVPRPLCLYVREADVVSAALRSARPPEAQKPPPASAPLAVPVAQPLSDAGFVPIQRPKGVDTVTHHPSIPALGVVCTPGDPHGPSALRPDNLPDRPTR